MSERPPLKVPIRSQKQLMEFVTISFYAFYEDGIFRASKMPFPGLNLSFFKILFEAWDFSKPVVVAPGKGSLGPERN